ncbi:MAG TPA: hypothetical protein DD723_09485 [Candidatus Omnitrophica bacterium]|nr:MAG: hypothetical protein A2Y04_02355 [Omnitrophica WOR_2 bacterium GWC2_45_7]HBR15749.1 hypothetical protein [Candidatus Omnitrophota bacterium]
MNRLKLRIECNLKEIREKGMPCIFVKAGRLLLRLTALILAIPVVFFIVVLKPFMRVRFLKLRSDRLGHYGYEPERYLCQRDAGLHGPPNFDIFYNEGNVCNKQLKKMWESKLLVLRIPHIALLMTQVRLLLRKLPGCGEHVFEIQGIGDFHPSWSLCRTQPHLQFTPQEEEAGQEALRKMGIPSGAQYVCIYGRDSAYLNQAFSSRDWTYHDYRDDDIQTYLMAAEMLTTRGHYVIRMGHHVKEALKTTNPMIIDYAAKGYRTDFLDIYLPATCRFFLGNPSGLVAIPAIFRRPIAYVNFSQPPGFYNWDLNGIFIYKRVWKQEEKRFFSYQEMLELNLPIHCCRKDLPEIARLGEIDIVDNTPQEIQTLAMEMDDRINGRYPRMTGEDRSLLKRFKALYPHIHDDVKFSTIGAEFLRENADLLEKSSPSRIRV